MELKDAFKTLAIRAGIPETDAKLVATLDQIPDLDVDEDTISKPMLANLITESEAESRPSIKKKYTAEALNGVDAMLDKELGEFFTPEQIEDFKKDQKPTMKKIGQLLVKAKEFKSTGGNSSEAADTIRKLNEQISTLTSTKDGEIETLKSQHQRERFMDKLAAKVLGRADVTDQAKAKDGRRVLADFDDTVNSVGGVLDLATGKIMTKADPSLPLFIDSKEATVDGLMERTLKDNEWLKKSNPVPETIIEVKGSADDAKTGNSSVSKNLANAKAFGKAE